MSRPRVLFIAPALPDRRGSGLAMRMGVFLDAFAEIADVDLAIIPISGPANAPSLLVRELGITPQIIPIEDWDTRFALLSTVKDAEARLAAFEQLDRPSLCAGLSAGALGKLKTIAEGKRYDLVHIARLYLAPLRALWRGAVSPCFSIDIDEDDVTARNSIARSHLLCGNRFASRWERIEARHFAHLQREFLPQFQLATISTGLDALRIEARMGLQHLRVVHNAVPLPASPAPHIRSTEPPVLLFVGSFGFWPNVDAALWFCRSVWDPVRACLPSSAELRIIGRDPPPAILAAARKPQVHLLTDVAELAPHYRRASLSLVPIRAGAGSRIKLLEAAAWRVPIVATPLGAEGSGMRHGADCLLARNAKQMTRICIDALTDGCGSDRRAQNAFVRVRDRSWHRAKRMLLNHVAALLAQGDVARTDDGSE